MARRYYSSTAASTSLSSGISNSATSITVGSVSGFPGSYPYTLIIDPDTASEEVVSVTAGAGTTLTVTRGQDGTSGVSHNAAAVVRHGVSARDFDEPNSHVNASAAVHGLTGTVVGTSDSQTLTNKTLTSPALTTPTVDGNALSGAWTTWTPTFTNITGGAGSFAYKLIGSNTMLVRLYFSAGTYTATATASVSIPAGKTGKTGLAQQFTGGSMNFTISSTASAITLDSKTAGTGLTGTSVVGFFEVN